MKVHSDIISLLLIGGIAVGVSQCDRGAGITCPTLRKYSTQFLERAGQQYRAVEKIAPDLIIMIDDYGVDRDAIRKCIQLRGKKR